MNKTANPQHQSYWISLRTVPATNGTGFDVPAYGFVELEGSDDTGYTMLRPRKDNCKVFVNGPVLLPTGMKGQVFAGGPLIISADEGEVFANGESWGAKKDSFFAVKGKLGFLILTADGSNRAWAKQQEGSFAGDAWQFVRLVSSEADAGSHWVGWVQKWNGSAWVDDYECRVKILEGTRFIFNKRYPLRREDTVTETIDDEEVEFELFHGNGNEPDFLTLCIDNVDKCYRFDQLAPFRRVEVNCDTKIQLVEDGE